MLWGADLYLPSCFHKQLNTVLLSCSCLSLNGSEVNAQHNEVLFFKSEIFPPTLFFVFIFTGFLSSS